MTLSRRIEIKAGFLISLLFFAVDLDHWGATIYNDFTLVYRISFSVPDTEFVPFRAIIDLQSTVDLQAVIQRMLHLFQAGPLTRGRIFYNKSNQVNPLESGAVKLNSASISAALKEEYTNTFLQKMMSRKKLNIA